MKIVKDNKLKNKINEVIRINQINTWVAELFNEVNSYTDFFSTEKINNYIKQGYSEPAAMVNIMYDEFNFDKNDEETIGITDEYCVKRIKCLEPKEYLNDKYVQTIKATGRYKQYAFRNITYEPYQTFAYDEISVTTDYKEYSAIGYFK